MVAGIYNSIFGQKDSMTVNGKKVEIYTAGLENNFKDQPVIVFENGMATRYIWWKSIIDSVCKKNSVFAYNRPRIGTSEDDSLPPTMKHIVDNLRQMLMAKGLNPPYLLVGHSFGGAYIRSFASYYPDEIAGLIFVDPIDFTKKAGYGLLPYLEMGVTEHQFDSLFADPYDDFIKKLYEEMPGYYVEEVKISREISASGFEECTQNPLPDVPVHFIQAGGYKPSPDEKPTIYDREKMFRVDNFIKMKRWLELLNPLKFGKFFYSSNSGHFVQTDDPALIISSITLALKDYQKIQREK